MVKRQEVTAKMNGKQPHKMFSSFFISNTVFFSEDLFAWQK